MIKVGYDGGATFTRVVELPLSAHERSAALDQLHEPSAAQQRLPISTQGFSQKAENRRREKLLRRMSGSPALLRKQLPERLTNQHKTKTPRPGLSKAHGGTESWEGK